MGSRTGDRGNDPETYDDEGLRKEIVRVQNKLRFTESPSASLRKKIDVRLYNLRKEAARRGLENE